MARSGETINNPVTGEMLTWRQVAADTGGRLVMGEMVLPPGGFVTAEHVHRNEEERQEIGEQPPVGVQNSPSGAAGRI